MGKEQSFTRENEGPSTPRELAKEALDHFRRAANAIEGHLTKELPQLPQREPKD